MSSNRNPSPGAFGMARRVFRSWFLLTAAEQKAVLIILALFLLGLVARWRHGNLSAPAGDGAMGGAVENNSRTLPARVGR